MSESSQCTQGAGRVRIRVLLPGEGMVPALPNTQHTLEELELDGRHSRRVPFVGSSAALSRQLDVTAVSGGRAFL